VVCLKNYRVITTESGIFTAILASLTSLELRSSLASEWQYSLCFKDTFQLGDILTRHGRVNIFTSHWFLCRIKEVTNVLLANLASYQQLQFLLPFLLPLRIDGWIGLKTLISNTLLVWQEVYTWMIFNDVQVKNYSWIAC